MNKVKYLNLDSIKEEILLELTNKFNDTTYYETEKINITLDLKERMKNQMTENQIEAPNIYITTNTLAKVRHVVDANKGEVAWHCLIEQHPNNVYIIADILIFPQEVTAATADGIDGEYEMWLATLPDEQFEHNRGHGHSHVNMGVTPSCVDESYYRGLMTQVEDFYITFITNKAGLVHLRFYDKINNLLWTNLTWNVCTETGLSLNDWYEEASLNIKELKPKVILPLAPHNNYKSKRDKHTKNNNYDYDFFTGADEYYSKKNRRGL